MVRTLGEVGGRLPFMPSRWTGVGGRRKATRPNDSLEDRELLLVECAVLGLTQFAGQPRLNFSYAIASTIMPIASIKMSHQYMKGALLGVVAIALSAWGMSDRSTRSSSMPQLGELGGSSAHDASMRRTLWLAHDVYSQLVRTSDHVMSFHLKWDDPLTAEESQSESHQYNWSVAYSIDGFSASLGPHEFTVWGTAQNGDIVLEHFDLAPPVGAHDYSSTTSPLPTASIVGGGPYLPPSQRQAVNPPTRKELYRGSSMGQDIVVANDPSRRYSYVVSKDMMALNCVSWTSGSVSSYDLGPFSSLLSVAISAQVQSHSTEGDKLKVTLGLNDRDADYLILSDYDGDGVFDGHQVLDATGYSQLGYPGIWSNDFIRHVGFLAPD